MNEVEKQNYVNWILLLESNILTCQFKLTWAGSYAWPTPKAHHNNNNNILTTARGTIVISSC